MRESLRDPEAVADVIRRRALRELLPVVSKLARAARGHQVFQTDHEMRACVALTHLMPALVGAPPKPKTGTRAMGQPEWMRPERLEQLRKLCEARDNLTREGCAESWANEFRKRGPDDLKYATEEEAREYGRKQWDYARRSAAELQTQRTSWRSQ